MDPNIDVSNLTPRQREEIQSTVSKQLAQAQASELIQSLNTRCIKKCIDYPGTSLSGSQQTCLTRCMERYLEAFNVVASAYQRRLQQEGSGLR